MKKLYRTAGITILLLLTAVLAAFFVMKTMQQICSAAGFPAGGLFSWDAAVLEADAREELFETMTGQGLFVLYQAMPTHTEPELVRDFVREAARYQIQVWFLTGAPEWGLDPYGERMEEEIDRAAEYNADLPEESRIQGVLMDCEPYLLPEWEEDPEAVMDCWMSAMKEAHDRAEKQDLLLTACIPFYLDTEGFTSHLVDLLLEGCDGLAIMNYYREEEAEHVRIEVGFARVLEKPVTIIYELQKPGQHSLREINTYYDEGLAAVEESWKRLTETFGEEGLSFALHEYRALQEVTERE